MRNAYEQLYKDINQEFISRQSILQTTTTEHLKEVNQEDTRLRYHKIQILLHRLLDRTESARILHDTNDGKSR